MIVAAVRLYREGLAASLSARSNLVVVATSDDASSAIDQIQELTPDVVLVDTSTERSVDMVRALQQHSPTPKAIAFAVHEREQDIIAYAEAGAAGYVTSDASFEQLISAIEGVAREELICSPRMASIFFRRLGGRAVHGPAAAEPTLTQRERQVLAYIRDGRSNKEIAQALNVAEATVKNHVHNLLEKLQVSNRTQAARNTRAASAACRIAPAASRSSSDA